MITRVCISINNKCNLKCRYCHFQEKDDRFIKNYPMNVFKILDNIKIYITKHDIKNFKIGFVGNGEPLLNYNELKSYIEYISEEIKTGIISAYIISNGVSLTEDMLLFFKLYNVDIGFSIDGLKEIHDKWRCKSFDKVMKSIELYKKINGKNPSLNCTVGKDILDHSEETINFFEKFKSRITFSRMIGEYGISISDFTDFISQATEHLNIRTGKYDCTMYGGMCGAGINNYFYANGYIYICGNCIDVDKKFPYTTAIDEVDFNIQPFERTNCYKETFQL